MDLYMRLNQVFQNGRFARQAAKSLSNKRCEDRGEMSGASAAVVEAGRDT
jgi:hypothetical protein